MLRGVFESEMHYRNPHTAGPALWDGRQRHGFARGVGPAHARTGRPRAQGREALVIALHRQAHGAPPRMNLGRMPVAYRLLGANSASLVRRVLRAEGAKRRPRPVPRPRPAAHEPAWLGLAWSEWMPLGAAAARAAGRSGLYSIRRRGDPLLTYLGEGRVAGRLLAHKPTAAGWPTPSGSTSATPGSSRRGSWRPSFRRTRGSRSRTT